jgi:hypothetical protein
MVDFDSVFDYSTFALNSPLSCFDGTKGKYVDPDIAAALEDAKSPVLKVTMDATFSGVLTNKRVYPGRAMRRATRTWTQHYRRPVLPQHTKQGGLFQADEDVPVGRVIAAKYVKIYDGTQFDEDYKVPEAMGSRGSGYIALDTIIMGRENIEKVLDGRWSTTSTCHAPLAAICSICGQDWKTTGPCAHAPGKSYDVELDDEKSVLMTAYLIMPPGVYDHTAFVNAPAAPQSGVTGMALAADSTISTPELRTAPPLKEFVIMDASGGNQFNFFDDASTVDGPAKVRSLISLPSSLTHFGDSSPGDTTEDDMTEKKNLLEKIGDRISLHISMSSDDPTNWENQRGANITKRFEETPKDEDIALLAKQVLGFVSKDSDDDTLVLIDGLKEDEIKDEDIDDILEDFVHTFQIDKTDPKKRPGGSNAGKYSKAEGPFCGPTGGAPDGTYPIGTKARGRSAIKLSHNAPKPQAIKDCVYKKYPDLKPEKKKDQDEWSQFGIEKDFDALEEPNDQGCFIVTLGATEIADVARTDGWKADLPHPDAIPSADERKQINTLDFAGPNRTFLAGTREQVENAYKILEKTDDAEDLKEKIKHCLDLRAEVYGAAQADADSSDEPPQAPDGVASTEGADEDVIISTLTDKIKGLTKKVDNLKDTLGGREDEVKRLRTQSLSDKRANRELLISRLLDLKLALNKPEVVDCKTTKDLQALKDQFSSRSMESLLDSISDLRMELLGDLSSDAPAVDPDKAGGLVDDSVQGGQPPLEERERTSRPLSKKAQTKQTFMD